ncbi:hypothetical protein D3C81_1296640 [compost metagenome]
MELQLDFISAPCNRLNSILLRVDFQSCSSQQILYSFRRFAETVKKLVRKLGYLFQCRKRGCLFIDLNFLNTIINIFRR